MKIIVFVVIITLLSVSLTSISEEPLQYKQWGLEVINAIEARNLVPENHSRVVVAVLDTGVDMYHEELNNSVWDENGLYGVDLTTYSLVGCGYSLLLTKSCYVEKIPPEYLIGPYDFAGHGSHVSGIISAQENGVGILGVSDAIILPIKVMATANTVYSNEHIVAMGIYIAASIPEVRIISMSLGIGYNNSIVYSSVEYAWLNGKVLVAAAGNYNNSIPIYPCAYEHVICVSAINENLKPWNEYNTLGTNFGPFVDLTAPGANITSVQSHYVLNFGELIYTGGGYRTGSGTSYSVPFVSGVLVLMYEINPELTNVQTVRILKESTTDIGLEGHGTGLLNAKNAVMLSVN